MIYWYAAIVIGTFLLGFMLGLDKGIRNIHSNNKTSQMKKLKSSFGSRKTNKDKKVYDPMWSNERGLRLVKKDDTRE